jgi:stearoyl-CoA desaturase (delta-9 desaturase)
MVATFLSSISFFGDPLSYAISHRLHHKYADSTRDPHCPRDGLLHSYIGWILKFNPTNKDKLIVSDLIRKYPWTIPYLKIEPLVPIVFYSLIFYISATAGLTILLASVISFQIAICVNMLAHSDDGNGNYTATNNLLSATIVSSIFLHRNHHTSPSLYDYSTDQYVDKWGSFIKRFLTEK